MNETLAESPFSIVLVYLTGKAQCMTRKEHRERSNIYVALTVPRALDMYNLLIGWCDPSVK